MSMLLPGKATMTFYVLSVVGLLLVSFVSQGKCQTTAPPPPPCSINKNCDSCVPHAKCLWCFTSNNCTDYPVTWLLPPASLCPLSQARWGVCWLNFEALIIALAVVAGTILISISVCCCCCCCCKRRRPGPDRDEERFARRREEIRQRAEERKVERQSKHDEIRRKYGIQPISTKENIMDWLPANSLMGDSDHPYSKFENE